MERELRRSEKEEKRLEERARDNDLEERDKLKQRLDRLNQQNAIADEKIAVSYATYLVNSLKYKLANEVFRKKVSRFLHFDTKKMYYLLLYLLLYTP